tara:strand:- start:7158 stop:7637 length:480 start_codon:yes stop_codon:yes gene_type:complete
MKEATSNQVDPKAVADMLIISPEHLCSVEVGLLDSHQLRLVEDSVHPGQCYNNALMTALAVGGDKVVLGATFIDRFGLAVEHAWLQMPDGSYFDPTYQLLDDTYRPERDYQYFALWSVDVDDYLDAGERLRGVANMAIDFLALRTAPETRHLFEYRRSA